MDCGKNNEYLQSPLKLKVVSYPKKSGSSVMKILMSSPSPGVESIVDVVGCGVTLIVIGLLWEVSHGPTYPNIAVSSSDME